MPPKQPTTDHLLHRILTLLETIADSLANESLRHDARNDAMRTLVHQAITAIATLPQEMAEALSAETLDRLRHVKYWLAKLEEQEPQGARPPSLPPPPVAPRRDDSQAIPLMVELHGRWGLDEIKPKLWKVVPWLIAAGTAGYHVVQWVVAHGH